MFLLLILSPILPYELIFMLAYISIIVASVALLEQYHLHRFVAYSGISH